MLKVGDVLASKNQSPDQVLQEARWALNGPLVDFMPRSERLSLLQTLRDSEERYGIAQVVLDAKKRIDECPVTYAQDGAEDPMVHLHYFRGGVDAWITEKDVDWPAQGDYDQSFGFVNLMGTRKVDAEMGYTSIKEMIESGVELDLYFTPKRWSEVK
jgi:hypothetical protein